MLVTSVSSSAVSTAMPYMLDNDAFGDREYWDRVTMENIQELRLRLQQWPERHELREEILPRAVLEQCIVYPHGKDMAGCHVLVLRSKNYIKGLADRDSVKRIFIFFIEQLFKECGAKKITVLIDCSDIGVSNIDVDLLKFVVDVFISRYPIGLGNALIYNMPWLLNAILRMIKSLLPYGAERLKTVNKDDIQQYIDAKHLPVRMGGTDTYEYSYVPGRPLGDRARY
ncbi:motile sperm domain-containing protein 2 isoform X2 [Dermacentor silvarum]|uniref:motile sperm domain-containing protein 2 isoform X2 n=1 Tax=Dermacentor silvarum TaxID=543639 RepID=UPI0021018D79|nr:motile sperm domain-containing protein 2 isoform X2 [Dermacentor silvarum]